MMRSPMAKWTFHRVKLALTGFSLLLLGSSGAPAAAPTRSPDLRIGVYYFPGWDGAENDNWTAIKPYADREPLLGWYDDKKPKVLAQQLRWMKDFGLSYVAFDWYWQNGDVGSDGALRTYLSLPNKPVSFAINWANDHKGIKPAEWKRIVARWIRDYFGNDHYVRFDGKPVVFVLSQQTFVATATEAGSAPERYIAVAQDMARAAGLPGIAFIAGFDDLSYGFVTEDAPTQGFAGVSSYNLHRSPLTPWKSGWDKIPHPLTRGYKQMDMAYRENWDAGATRSKLPVVIPMTTGWDARPWGGSAEAAHDRSVATAAEFRAHLRAARAAMLRPGAQRSGLGIICCWNEYGEGSYLEPTKARQFSLLKQVKDVFGK